MLLVQLIKVQHKTSHLLPSAYIGWLLPLRANQHLDYPAKIGENVLNFCRKVLHKKIYSTVTSHLRKLLHYHLRCISDYTSFGT